MVLLAEDLAVNVSLVVMVLTAVALAVLSG